MEKIKIMNFCKDNKGIEFPYFRTLSLDEANVLSEKLKSIFSENKNISNEKFTQFIDNIEITVPSFNASISGFNLLELFKCQKISVGGNVYVNWYRYDKIDELSVSDLSILFDYIWYEGSDDIDVFDSSCSWILSISHYGVIKVIKDNLNRDADPIS